MSSGTRTRLDSGNLDLLLGQNGTSQMTWRVISARAKWSQRREQDVDVASRTCQRHIESTGTHRKAVAVSTIVYQRTKNVLLRILVPALCERRLQVRRQNLISVEGFSSGRPEREALHPEPCAAGEGGLRHTGIEEKNLDEERYTRSHLSEASLYVPHMRP